MKFTRKGLKTVLRASVLACLSMTQIYALDQNPACQEGDFCNNGNRRIYTLTVNYHATGFRLTQEKPAFIGLKDIYGRRKAYRVSGVSLSLYGESGSHNVAVNSGDGQEIGSVTVEHGKNAFLPIKQLDIETSNLEVVAKSCANNLNCQSVLVRELVVYGRAVDGDDTTDMAFVQAPKPWGWDQGYVQHYGSGYQCPPRGGLVVGSRCGPTTRCVQPAPCYTGGQTYFPPAQIYYSQDLVHVERMIFRLQRLEKQVTDDQERLFVTPAVRAVNDALSLLRTPGIGARHDAVLVAMRRVSQAWAQIQQNIVYEFDEIDDRMPEALELRRYVELDIPNGVTPTFGDQRFGPQGPAVNPLGPPSRDGDGLSDALRQGI